jgi:hypothetical protein
VKNRTARTTPDERVIWREMTFPPEHRLLADPEAADVLTQCRCFGVRLEVIRPSDTADTTNTITGLRIERNPANPPPRRLTRTIGRLTDRLIALLSATTPPQSQLLTVKDQLMVDVHKLYQSPYLKAADLPAGKRVLAEVAAETSEWLNQRDGSQQEKPVLTLRHPDGREWGKKWIVGNMMSKLLAKQFGSGETGDWVGKRLYLWSEDIVMNSQVTQTIRAAAASSLPPPPPPQRHIPASSTAATHGPADDDDLNDTIPF